MTGEQLALLVARLAEPDAAAELNDGAAADIINAAVPGPAAWHDITTSEVQGHLLATFEWVTIEDAAVDRFDPPLDALDAPTRAQLRRVCKSFVALMARASVEMTNPTKRGAALAGLAGLRDAGIIAQASHDAIVAMSYRATATNWPAQNDWPGGAVTAQQVGLARGGRL